MDARRFDRNADQLSQILNHYRLIRDKLPRNRKKIMLENAIVMLEACLDINDDLAEAVLNG